MEEENKNVENGEVVELEEEIKTENEGIKISNDVVAVIAGVAVFEQVLYPNCRIMLLECLQKTECVFVA